MKGSAWRAESGLTGEGPPFHIVIFAVPSVKP
jgi:hypothetical protein